MFLYDKKEREIEIYSFEADKEALIEYRKKIIENRDRIEMFYKFETTSESLKNRFVNADELDVRFLDHRDTSRDASDWWSEISQIKFPDRTNQIEQDELLRKYINGDFSETLPTRTFIPDEGVDCYLKSYLVTDKPSSVYSNVEKRNYYRFKNLINLPKELCTLHLLQNGKFDRIMGTWLDFDEQLQFFSATQLDTVNAEDLVKMFEYGLLNGNYDSVMRQVDTTQRVLRKMGR